jgi:hypothetical protein
MGRIEPLAKSINRITRKLLRHVMAVTANKAKAFGAFVNQDGIVHVVR